MGGKNSETLSRGLSLLGFPREEAQALARKMEAYVDELLLFNSARNLVSARDRDEIIVRHVLDSLAPAALFKSRSDVFCDGGEIADIGSGGGLPGIPLAAAFPSLRFVLVERMDSRCAFLENCAAVLGLSNVAVQKSEVEKLSPEIFDAAVFRAFCPLDGPMATALLRVVKKDGALAAYKARRENIEREMRAIANIVPRYEVLPLAVPFMPDEERNLVVVVKE